MQPNRLGGFYKLGEPGIARTDQSPEHPDEHQQACTVSKCVVDELQPLTLRSNPGARKANHQQPVEHPHRDIPNQHVQSPTHLTVNNHDNTSAFSCDVHSLPKESLQLRLNHFSTLASSVKRAGLALGERGLMTLAVTMCLESRLGGLSWHEAQLHCLPCLALKNCSPRLGDALADCASYPFNKSCGVTAMAENAQPATPIKMPH